MNRIFRLLPLLCLAAALGATPAAAHPHVWVDAKAEIVFDEHGAITAIRHIWQFDPDFTAYATLNLDANNDGKLSEDELAPLAQTNMDALHEYDYFTHLYVGTKKIAFAKPEEYWLDFHNKRLTLFYTLPLKTPLPLHGAAMLEIGDPEYFVAMSFIKNAEVHLENPPKGCTAAYRPPRELDAQTMAVLGAIPADQRDLPPDLVQAASVLTNVINLNCPKAVGAVPPKPGAGTEATTAPAPPALQDTLTPDDSAIVAPPAPALNAPQVAANEPSRAQPPTVEIPSEALPPAAPTAQPGFFDWIGQMWRKIFG